MDNITPFEQLSLIIKNRRSVFPAQFVDKPIHNETINLILENANWAPTHRMTEPWRFHIIKGDSLSELGFYLGDRYKANPKGGTFSEAKYKKTIKKTQQSAAVIGISFLRDPKASVPEWEEIAATAMAVQNIWLTCESLGIGTYWSSPATFIKDNTFLEMEEGEQCLGLMYLGYYDESTKTTGDRKPISDKVKWYM